MTIPKSLAEKFGIDASGEVFVYAEAAQIVIEPVSTLDELYGIHAGEPNRVRCSMRFAENETRKNAAKTSA